MTPLEIACVVSDALDALGVMHVLGGSVASSLQGDPRSTNDIDFAVRLSEADVAGLALRLGPEFDVDEAALRVFFIPDMMKIDLFIRGDETFDESVFARRKKAGHLGRKDVVRLFARRQPAPEADLVSGGRRSLGSPMARCPRDPARFRSGARFDVHVGLGSRLGVSDLLARALTQR